MNLRPQRQRARDADALPLAAAELVREAAERRLVEAHGAQQFGGRERRGLAAAGLAGE